MYIKTDKTKVFLKNFCRKDDVPTFFFHGFGGNSNSWSNILEKLNHNTFAIDLPGHRKSDFLDINVKYTFNEWCNDFYFILNHLNITKVNICGYSLGGRLAMVFACRYKHMINSLIIESSSFGIENDVERYQRLLNDRENADKIKVDLDSFMDEWQANDLFKKQQQRNKLAWTLQNTARREHNSTQLSTSYLSFCLGNMPFIEDELMQLDFPIYYICGNEDNKYVKLGKRITYLNKNAHRYIIDNAGHNTHLEQPDLYAELLDGILFDDL